MGLRALAGCRKASEKLQCRGSVWLPSSLGHLRVMTSSANRDGNIRSTALIRLEGRGTRLLQSQQNGERGL
jgi:hypothetical protein